MDWVDEVQRLRAQRTPAVIVTLAAVRGHAPRNSGAKMVVSSDGLWGTVGGGNLEATAVGRARRMLGSGSNEPELLTLQLSDKATVEYGVQCCGGEVTVLLEPIRIRPSVAIFGIGHVGLELARILSRQDIELHLVDSRVDMLTGGRLRVLADSVAELRVHVTPVPESILAELPAGSHVLIMTHDHFEDLALCDSALRTAGLDSIGLIGSRSKWTRFQKQLREAGHGDAELARIDTPIGIGGIRGKEPATIAVSAAARMLQLIEAGAVRRSSSVVVAQPRGHSPSVVDVGRRAVPLDERPDADAGAEVDAFDRHQ